MINKKIIPYLNFSIRVSMIVFVVAVLVTRMHFVAT
jgi:hypothetical protein